MFCFPNAGHVYWTVSFKLHLIHMQTWSAHKKRQSVKFPSDPILEKQNIQAKDGYWSSNGNLDFRIQETFAWGIWNPGIFSWNPESWALEFNDWNPKSITWNPESPTQTPESKTVLSCVFCLISSIQQSFVASGNYKFRARTRDRPFSSFVNRMAIFMWLVSTIANMMDTRIRYYCIYRKGKK